MLVSLVAVLLFGMIMPQAAWQAKADTVDSYANITKEAEFPADTYLGYGNKTTEIEAFITDPAAYDGETGQPLDTFQAELRYADEGGEELVVPMTVGEITDMHNGFYVKGAFEPEYPSSYEYWVRYTVDGGTTYRDSAKKPLPAVAKNPEAPLSLMEYNASPHIVNQGGAHVLTWQGDYGTATEVYYHVARAVIADGVTGEYERIATVQGVRLDDDTFQGTYIDDKLEPSARFSYQIQAFDAFYNFAAGRTYIELDDFPSAWPEGASLTAAGAGAGSVTLKWTAASNSTVTYRVYGGPQGGELSQLKSVDANTLETTITGLPGGATYRFRVDALDAIDYPSQGPTVDNVAIAAPSAPPVMSLPTYTFAFEEQVGTVTLPSNVVNRAGNTLEANLDQRVLQQLAQQGSNDPAKLPDELVAKFDGLKADDTEVAVKLDAEGLAKLQLERAKAAREEALRLRLEAGQLSVDVQLPSDEQLLREAAIMQLKLAIISGAMQLQMGEQALKQGLGLKSLPTQVTFEALDASGKPLAVQGLMPKAIVIAQSPTVTDIVLPAAYAFRYEEATKEWLPALPSTPGSVSGETFALGAVTQNHGDLANSYAKDAIIELLDRGVIPAEGEFDPTAGITRQQMAIVLARALGLNLSNPSAGDKVGTFQDVDSGYALPYVEAATAAGVVAGMGNGSFSPDRTLTREEMAVLFGRALEAAGIGQNTSERGLPFSDSGNIAPYAQGAVSMAVEAGLIHGMSNGTFDPKGAASRQDVALVASRFLKLTEQKKQD